MNENKIRKHHFTGEITIAICVLLLVVLGICPVSADTGTRAPAISAITPAGMYSVAETNPDLQQGILPDGFVLDETLPGWKYHSDLKNSGVYDDGGWRPNGLELWNVSDTTGSDISTVVSSPAVIDGVVYVTDSSDPGHLFAINAKTGAIKWENTLSDGSWTSPAVANGMVYVGTGWPGSDTPGTFYAFNASTGGSNIPVWSKTLPYGPVGSSPAVAYGNVYVGRGDHNVSAWNATTGAVVWTFPTSTEVYSSPAVYNGNVYFSTPDESGGSNIFAVNAITGAKVWDAKNVTGYGIGGMTFNDAGADLGSSPAVADGVLYIGGYSGVFAFDASTGAQLREFNDTVGSYYLSTPAVANGLVYFGTHGANPHHFYALNANDFSVNWSNQTPDDTEMDSSPAVANGIVYVTSENPGNLADKGFLYAWNATTGTGLWKFPLAGGGTQSSPAVANGVVYTASRLNGFHAVGTEHKGVISHIGVFRNSTHTFFLDKSGNGAWGSGDKTASFGSTGDIPVSGDWNIDGSTEIGVFRNSTHKWYLDMTGDEKWNTGDRTTSFGNSGDRPIAGDWNNDGRDEIGAFRNSTHTFYLDKSGNGIWGGGDASYSFGNTGDLPAVGDWNNDGKTEIGVFRSSTHKFYLDATGNGAWGTGDWVYTFGNTGDLPVTADWNNDGYTEIGVYRSSTHTFYLDKFRSGTWGAGDATYSFGNTWDTPVSGTWS